MRLTSSPMTYSCLLGLPLSMHSESAGTATLTRVFVCDPMWSYMCLFVSKTRVNSGATMLSCLQRLSRLFILYTIFTTFYTTFTTFYTRLSLLARCQIFIGNTLTSYNLLSFYEVVFFAWVLLVWVRVNGIVVESREAYTTSKQRTSLECRAYAHTKRTHLGLPSPLSTTFLVLCMQVL